MTIGPTGSAYSQLPKDARTEWIVPRRVKEAFVAFAVLALAIVGVTTVLRHATSDLDRAKGKVEADELEGPAPPFELPGRGGGNVSLAQRKGKLLLVNFWATWCPPCRDEEPSLDALARTYDPASFEVLAVSVDEDWPTVEKYLAGGKNYTVALDLGAKTSLRYGTSKFPESYLVDASGALRLKFVGPRNWADPAVFTLLEKLGARRRPR